MFSKEKFNKLIEEQLKDLNENEKQQMYSVMHEKYNQYSTEQKKESRSSPGMSMKGGPRGSMMMEMMSTMMTGGMREKMMGSDNPMKHCMEMMSAMMKRSDDTKHSNDELMDLFKDWCGHVEDEIVRFIEESGEIDEENIAEKFHLSDKSVSHLLNSMKKAGKINEGK